MELPVSRMGRSIRAAIRRFVGRYMAVKNNILSQGLEHGPGFIRYQNGNTLDAEFVAGKIQGHVMFRCGMSFTSIESLTGVYGYRYDNGDQREGFFKDNILDGQVIFTR